MDIDLLGLDLLIDDSSKSVLSKRPIFQPNTSKFNRKPKHEGQPPLPVKFDPDPLLARQKEPELVPALPNTIHSEKEVPEAAISFDYAKPEIKDEEESVSMDGDSNEEDDRVVREIDVYFRQSPLDDNAELYIMQYPLRPCWRPYDNFKEVRVKPKQSKLEVDLSMDLGNENHDPEVLDRLKLQKQTLTSSKAVLVTGYAVGVLTKNELHLNPVHAVAQLRPSLSHLRNVGKKKSNRTMEVGVRTDKGKAARETQEQQNIDDAEPWLSLEYYDAESTVSSTYRQKMIANEGSCIPFSMGLHDYITSLCPRAPDSKREKAISVRSLLSLPMSERFKRWFSEGSEVHRFAALMHLAPTISEGEALKVVKQYADLVQGLWVAKSKLRCGGVGVQALARDYVMLLFTKIRIITKKQLKSVGIPYGILENVLAPLAVKRPLFDDWKFMEPDEAFQKKHPDIVKEQKREWSFRERQIMDSLNKCGKAAVAKNLSKPSPANNATVNVVPRSDVQHSRTPLVMPHETREALPKALEDIISTHKICSMQLICQGLRDMGVPEAAASKFSLAKTDPGLAKAASFGASAPISELQSIIKQVAVDIHGVYVLRPHGSSDLDNLRRVVINLFCGREPNARLKKADIIEAAKIILKRDITNQEYTKVVGEYCLPSRGGWTLRICNGS